MPMRSQVRVSFRTIVRYGSWQCLWLGICMLLSLHFHRLEIAFVGTSPANVVIVGSSAIVAGLIGIAHPLRWGGGPLAIVSGIRIIQAIDLNNLYTAGVWAILIFAMVFKGCQIWLADRHYARMEREVRRGCRG